MFHVCLERSHILLLLGGEFYGSQLFDSVSLPVVCLSGPMDLGEKMGQASSYNLSLFFNSVRFCYKYFGAPLLNV